LHLSMLERYERLRRIYRQVVADALFPYLRLAPGERMLWVGDDHTLALPSGHAGGVELIRDFEDGTILPYPADHFELVVVFHKLEDLALPIRMLREVNRVLRPGQRLVLISYHVPSLWALRRLWHRRREAKGRAGFTLANLRHFTAEAGFALNEGQLVLFAPPLQSIDRPKWVETWEHIGRRWFPLLGSVAVIGTVKTDWATTPLPLKMSLRERNRIAISAARPTNTCSGPHPCCENPPHADTP